MGRPGEAPKNATVKDVGDGKKVATDKIYISGEHGMLTYLLVKGLGSAHYPVFGGSNPPVSIGEHGSLSWIDGIARVVGVSGSSPDKI